MLDWAEEFVTTEVEPVDQVITHAWDLQDPLRQKLIPPLQDKVREQGLWATHLGPELGGQGFGQLKLALLNEIVGRTHSGPSSSAHRHRTRATPKSSRTTAPPNSRSGT